VSSSGVSGRLLVAGSNSSSSSTETLSKELLPLLLLLPTAPLTGVLTAWTVTALRDCLCAAADAAVVLLLRSLKAGLECSLLYAMRLLLPASARLAEGRPSVSCGRIQPVIDAMLSSGC